MALTRAVKPPATRRRCQGCYRAKRFWLRCTDCGVERACTDYAASWRCAPCVRHRELLAGRVAGAAWRSGVEDDAGRALLYDAHLYEEPCVDAWVMPESAELCLLVLARLVLWRRYGVLAGLVRGAGAVSWSNGTKVVDTGKLIAHLEQLRAAAQWPPGREPVLLSGCRKAHVQAVQHGLDGLGWPASEYKRLVPLPLPLSEHGNTRGFKTQTFLAAPSTVDCALIRRCRRACSAACITVTACVPLDAVPVARQPSLDAFRRMLFTR